MKSRPGDSRLASSIGLIAVLVAVEAALPITVARRAAIPSVRNESAGGAVIPPPIGRVSTDEAARSLARARLRVGEVGTYIPEILLERDSALVRWHDRPLRPVTVWVQSAPALDDWNDAYVRSVADAFRTWDALGLPVRFRVVPDSIDAEVHVTWIDRFSTPISGRTRWSRDDSWWIIDASIVLAVHHQHGEVLDTSALRAMALHEIGHLLGLDHTSDRGSIMAPRVRVRDLAPMDGATIRLLYSVPAGTVR